MAEGKNQKNKLLVSRLAWNNRGWRGFDFDGYENRKKLGFKYVKDHGFAHEWWNFYPYDEDHYYGHVDYHGGKIPSSIQNDALVLFISKNYNDNKLYFVGFYSHTEFGKYEPEIKLIDTINDNSIRKQVLDDITNSKVSDDPESSIKNPQKYSSKARRQDSTVFIRPIPIDITEDLGLKKLGSPSYYLVREDKPIKHQNVKKTLEKAVRFYEDLLHSTEFEQQSVREIIQKTERAISDYFDSSEIYGGLVEMTKLKTILESKKQIILYGPPGTGKTWHAQHLLRNDENQYYSQTRRTLFDQRVFSITILPPRDGSILDLQPGDTFTYEWSGRRNWQKFYDELEAGDHLLAFYPSPTQQYKAILRCNRKDENAIHSEFVRKWDGPTYQQMKSDSILSETMMIRVSMSFSLKKLDDVEFERIQALSPELTNKSLGLVSTRDEEKINKIEFVTFHPSFGYEEFIEGLRPKTDEYGTLTFHINDGIFKQFAQTVCNILFKEAGIDKQWLPEGNIPGLDEYEKKRIRETAPKIPFYLVIDEINRGDISRIFGELITLLEADKRYGEVNEIITTLPYSKTSFAIPPNLYLVGTMNTADKSIALVDTALRRRFGFIEMMPDYELLQRLFVGVPDEVKPIAELATSLLEEINTRIRNRYDRDHQIGHSYLVPLKDAKTRDEAVEILRSAWYYEILPLLQEYFYDSPQKLHEIIGSSFVSVEGEHSFSFTDELSGEAFIGAVEGIASPDSGTLIEEGSD